MNTWNFRIVHSVGELGYERVSLHEVYYNNVGEIELWCSEPEKLEGYDDLADLTEGLRLMLKDASKYPVLERSDLPTDEQMQAYVDKLIKPERE